MAPNIIQKTLWVRGMTCIQCENRIKRALRETDGVTKASVSYEKGTVVVSYNADRVSLQTLTAVLEKLGYQVVSRRETGSPDLIRTINFLVIIVCLYLLLQQFGVLNLLAPSQLAETGMGYGMLFFIGLATSVHCVAMCGGINLSQCVPQPDADSAPSGSTAVFGPALQYNLGRVVSYTLIGFLLGFTGRLLGGGGGISQLLQGCLKLAAGALMVIMGVNMLGLFPWLRRLAIRPPRFLTDRLRARNSQSRRPLAVGLLNGLMPCGPLQSMQIAALATGSAVAGGLSMLAFGLGTVPLMLGLGSLVSVLGKRFSRAVTTVGAVLVVVLGLAMVSQGGSLSGLLSEQQLLRLILVLCILGAAASIPFPSRASRAAGLAAAVCAAALVLMVWPGAAAAGGSMGGEAELVDNMQVVSSTLSAGKYPDITVQAGTPVRWIIDAPAGSITGCNYKMLLQEYGIEHTFTEGENILEFTPTRAGTVAYSCWMGMIRGTIHVTDPAGT